MKKIIALLLAMVMAFGLVACGGSSKPAAEAPKADAPAAEAPAAEAPAAEADKELPVINFTHGYFHSESEWPVAAEMRAIYQEFADMHKDEFVFNITANEAGSEGIYNTALNDLAAGEFYDIADFAGYEIAPVAAAAGAILDLKPYLDADESFKNSVGVCYEQNMLEDGGIYCVREQIEAVGFWYNEALFAAAGAKVPGEWETWADFDAAVDALIAADITPFALNNGWPTNILLAGYNQRNADSRAFHLAGKNVDTFDSEAFKGSVAFMQANVLQKLDVASFDPTGGEAYRDEFFAGNTAMLFNGVWDAGGSIDCGAGAENIKPAVFPTDEPGKKASLLSGCGGFVVSANLDEAQTAACIEFIKYMTSPEIAARIIAKGIGMAPSSELDYDALANSVDTADAKLLVEACRLCQSAEYKALGLGNAFGDYEGEIASKYAGLMDGSKTVEDVVADLNDFMAAAE